MIKISAILLTILMLVSSISISIDVHYCQNELKSISLFGKAKSCHDSKVKQTCHHSTKTSSNKKVGLNKVQKDNCCHNDRITFEKSDIKAPSSEFIHLNTFHLKFIASFIVSFFETHTNNIVQNKYREYKPPLFQSDILVSYQVFRI